MVEMRKFAARLDVFIASKALKAVVLRRGPAKRVCTIGWDLTTDTFQLGQWLKGRIYEHCSDLSPNGKYFIYFALNARPQDGWCWTAVSRAPYLKAIALWDVKGGYEGGGLFRSTSTYWLNNPSTLRFESAEVRRDLHDPHDTLDNHWGAVYFRRLLREGWKMKEKRVVGRWREAVEFEKPVTDRLILRKVVHELGRPGKATSSSDHELLNIETGEVLNLPNWDWADIDRHRLLWAEGGKLFAATIEKEEIGPSVVLYDFNDMVFEPIKAPY